MKWIVTYILLIPMILSGQSDTLVFQSVDWKRKTYSVAYLGNNLWNPGAQFSMEVPWIFRDKSKLITRKNSQVVRNSYRQINFNGDIGFYVDPYSHTGAFTSIGLQFRAIIFNDIALNFKANPIGYYRSFLKETYSVTDGVVEKVAFPGRNYYSPSMSFGFGEYNVNRGIKGWFVNLHIMIQAPYNAFVNPLLSINLGYTFQGRKRQKS